MIPDLQPFVSVLTQAVSRQGAESDWIRWVTNQVDEIQIRQAIIESARLQSKAVRQFGPGIWWCSERALMQSTHYRVAELKATWMGDTVVYDLCSGLGGDAMAVARRCTELILVDRDPFMVAMAMANCDAATDRDVVVQVSCDDVESVNIPADAMVHLDPDRRATGSTGSRTSRPEFYSPNWQTAERLIASVRGGLVKVAPAATLPIDPSRRHVWISHGGSVREQTIVFGEAIASCEQSLGCQLSVDHKAAFVVGKDAVATFTGAPGLSCRVSEQPQTWMVDPDPAIRAAGLTAAYAERFQLESLGGPAGFLTGGSFTTSDLAIAEPVLWSGSFDDRKLRRAMREHNVYPKRVKTRGVTADPNQLEKRYRKCGEAPVTLWIGKTGRRHYAAISQTQSL